MLLKNSAHTVDANLQKHILDPTASGRSAMGTRIGMRGPFGLLPLARVRRRLPLGRYCLRSRILCGLA